MNAEAINQAMALLDGWTRKFNAWYKAEQPMNGYFSVPSYTADLNAVARVVGKLGSYWPEYRGNIITKHGFDAIDATALQRCEAILRACGKWVDG